MFVFFRKYQGATQCRKAVPVTVVELDKNIQKDHNKCKKVSHSSIMTTDMLYVRYITVSAICKKLLGQLGDLNQSSCIERS